MRIQANKAQLSFLSLGTNYRAFVSGYGGGKTWVGCSRLCINAMRYPGIKQGCFEPTYRQITDIFYPEIEEVAQSFGLSVSIKESDKTVLIKSGRQARSAIICRSMDRPQSIVGFQIGHAMVDELDTIPKKKALDVWKKIIARLRQKSQDFIPGADITTTPEGFGAVHHLFVEAPSENPALHTYYSYVQSSTYLNKRNLPDGYIDQLKASYPSNLVDAYINGQFVNLASGSVYRSFDRAIHCSDEYVMDNEPLYIGMDFNVMKMAAVIFVKRGNTLYAVDELHHLLDTPQMAQVLIDRYPKNQKTIYPDATGRNRDAQNASMSDLSLLYSAGFRVMAGNVNPSVRSRVMAVNKAFEDGRIKINIRKCPETTKCIEQQAYDKNGEPDKSSGLDHQCDAFGYPIAYEMPIIVPIRKQRMVGF